MKEKKDNPNKKVNVPDAENQNKEHNVKKEAIGKINQLR